MGPSRASLIPIFDSLASTQTRDSTFHNCLDEIIGLCLMFAAPEPVMRDVLQGLIGPGCSLDEIVSAIPVEIHGRPYDLVFVAGGFQFRALPVYADAIRSVNSSIISSSLLKTEFMVLMAIAYFQPAPRVEVGKVLGRKVSRNVIAALRDRDMIAAGPRSPTLGTPYTYVTTKAFQGQFGFASLDDLPDLEALEEGGLLDKTKMDSGNLDDNLKDGWDEDL